MQHTKGNVVIKIDLTQKEKYRFLNGTEIIIPRGFDYNLRLDNPNVAEVLSAENIPTGSLVLIHHNACQDSYKAFELDNIFSIPLDMVFLYFHENKWIPNKNFVISGRIFQPYKGLLLGIENELVKNRMYIYAGEHAGNVCVTTKNCDYEIVFFINGRENRVIRTRVREILGIDEELTAKVKNGEYNVGINSQSSKPLTCQKVALPNQT